MSAKIINLFASDPPKREDTEWWEWGREFVEGEGYTNLELIVDEISTCENEAALRRVLTELKDEVDKIPL